MTIRCRSQDALWFVRRLRPTRWILHWTVALQCAATWPELLPAQTPSIPRGRDTAETIRRAEAEGRGYQQLPPPTSPPGAFTVRELSEFGLTTFSNHLNRACFEARESIVRSGDFVIGGQLGANQIGVKQLNLMARRLAKIWWAPLHESRDMSPLRIRAINLTNQRDTLTMTAASGYKSSGGHDASAKGEYFFPSGVTFPSSGRWLVIGTSDANWGCFILNVA